jgi:hypothetical protein
MKTLHSGILVTAVAFVFAVSGLGTLSGGIPQAVSAYVSLLGAGQQEL